MKKYIQTIILSIISIIILVTIGISIRDSDEGVLFDEKIMEYIHKRISPIGISIMKKITYLGSVYLFLPISLALLLIMTSKRKIDGIILLFLSTIGSYGLNFILKNIFIRTRPLKYFLIDQGGYSFPSGHSMVSMSFYTTMAYLLLKEERRKEVKILIWTINFLIIGLIGFSRLYLGVHWPTDVLTGYLLGYLFYLISRILIERF